MTEATPLPQHVRHGQYTKAMPMLRPSVMERLWARFIKTDSGCWQWTAATIRGYGAINLGKVAGSTITRYAHRVAYEYLVGPIPAGHDIDHLCRNTLCINPAHLEPVTRSKNAQRQNAHYRMTGAWPRWQT